MSSYCCFCSSCPLVALALAAAGRVGEEGSVLDEAEGPRGVGGGGVTAALGPHTLPVTDEADAVKGGREGGREGGR